ncbi:MAG: DUF92 domain-containing protein [Planctomycetota bacterium]
MTPLLGLLLANGLAAGAALAARALRPEAVATAFAVGAAVYWGGGFASWVLLATFVVVGSGLTKLGYRRKAALGTAQSDGGRRGVAEVLANGGVAAIAAILWRATGEPLLATALVGALATALADTAASEVGPVWGRRCVAAATWRPVPPGTEGAISLEGTLAGVIGAALIAGLAALGGVLAPSLVLIVVIAAALASWLESMVGSVARRGFLANNALQNLANTFVGAALAVLLERAA